MDTDRQRIVLHVDMDAFYAAIEQRDDPSLRGRCVIIGGGARRGVVATASYEARRFGVHSAMPGFEARRLCPHGLFLPPRIGYYAQVSAQIMEIFDRYSPDVEPLSLDEAFLDMTGAERLFGTPQQMAERIAADIRDELSLTASIGAASNKFIAKIASDMRKPDGITVVPPGTEKAFLAPLPLERIWGVGARAAGVLHGLGMKTIGDVAGWPLDLLEQRLGRFGAHIWHLAHGDDQRDVVRDRTRRSLGSERTLDRDVDGVAAVRRLLVPLADEVARGLRSRGWRACGVRVKVKYATFRQVTRDQHVRDAYCDSETLMGVVDGLLERLELDLPIRLVGITAYDLIEDAAPLQQQLFAEDTERREQLESVLDAVGARFGAGVVTRASSLRDDD